MAEKIGEKSVRNIKLGNSAGRPLVALQKTLFSRVANEPRIIMGINLTNATRITLT